MTNKYIEEISYKNMSGEPLDTIDKIYLEIYNSGFNGIPKTALHNKRIFNPITIDLSLNRLENRGYIKKIYKPIKVEYAYFPTKYGKNTPGYRQYITTVGGTGYPIRTFDEKGRGKLVSEMAGVITGSGRESYENLEDFGGIGIRPEIKRGIKHYSDAVWYIATEFS